MPTTYDPTVSFCVLANAVYLCGRHKVSKFGFHLLLTLPLYISSIIFQSSPVEGPKPTKSPITPTESPTDGTDEPTKSPATGPSLSPTKNPSKAPVLGSVSPTASPSSSVPTPWSSPEGALQGPVTEAGLRMTLSGVSSIENEDEWKATTEGFWVDTYNDSPEMSDTKVAISITGTKPNGRRRLLGRRDLQSDSSVEVIYTQTTSYRSDNPLATEDLFTLPLSTQANRDSYIGELKTLDGYEGLTAVSEISISSDKPPDGNESTDGGGLSLGAIIGIACAGAVVLIGGVGYIYYRQRNKDDDDIAQDQSRTALSSTQGATLAGTGTGSSSAPTYGDQSVATVDYDYSRAYGGDASLSAAGGTLGSQTRQTAGMGDPMVMTSGNTIFSDDQTFDQAYQDVKEELLDVYAPAGKLGVVIDTPDDGAPCVHAVKDTSPIADKVQVGDKLVAVDDEDVRAMTAIKVSKLISRKSNNASRKLTIIRHVSNN